MSLESDHPRSVLFEIEVAQYGEGYIRFMESGTHPDDNPPIQRARDEPRSVRQPRDRGDGLCVLLERAHTISSLQIR